MSALWYAYEANAGSARLVVTQLYRQLVGEIAEGVRTTAFEAPGVEIYLPIEQRRVARGGVVRRLERPLFGRYFFARLDLDCISRETRAARTAIQRQPGLGLVQLGDTILAVRDAEIAAIKAQENARGVVPFANLANVFAAGQEVNVLRGAFTTCGGTVQRIGTALVDRMDYLGHRREERVAVALVAVAMFGRETLVELEERDLEHA